MEKLFVSRSENKYLLSYVDALSLQKKLDKLLRRDTYSENGKYAVRSLYFDSLNNKDLYEKLAGLETRKKIRIRSYDPHGTRCKLEVKHKQGDAQSKKSIWIDRAETERLIAGDYGVLLDRGDVSGDTVWFYTQMSLGGYRPVTMIEYDRLAYVYDQFDTRITFDMNIRSTEACFDLFAEAPPYFKDLGDQVVLEVKYNGKLVKFLSELFKPYHLTRVAVSKYQMGRKSYLDFI